MFAGNYKEAIDAAHQLLNLLDTDVMKDEKMNKLFIPLFTVPLHVLIRFGKWEEILEEPFQPQYSYEYIFEHPDEFDYAISSIYYAKAIALSVLAGQHKEKKMQYILEA